MNILLRGKNANGDTNTCTSFEIDIYIEMMKFQLDGNLFKSQMKNTDEY